MPAADQQPIRDDAFDRYRTDHPDFDLAAVVAEAGCAPTPSLAFLDEVCHVPPLVPDTPAPTDIRRTNPREQGQIGLTDAIGWFGRRGWTVSMPLIDAQAYDLVVDLAAEGLAKVQVKTSTAIKPSGSIEVRLETAGGNQSFHTRKPFDNTATELLYVLAGAGRWVIPSCRIDALRTISVGVKWSRWQSPSTLPPGR